LAIIANNTNAISMKAAIVVLIFGLLVAGNNVSERQLQYNGRSFRTTFDVPQFFYGRYEGNGEGFLQLSEDGSGVFRYDYAALSKDCESALIAFEWGFVLDGNGAVMQVERPYGRSYPVIYNCSGPNAFKNCSERAMIDYLLVFDDGTVRVSSSDDWKKQN
jgi:hypothetical protein